jgi:hypothetical protein
MEITEMKIIIKLRKKRSETASYYNNNFSSKSKAIPVRGRVGL